MQRTSLNASKSGFTICKHRKLSKKIPNCQRSKTMIADKIDLLKISNCLVGGVNISEEFGIAEGLTGPPESEQEVVLSLSSFSPPTIPISSSPIEKSIEYAPDVKEKNFQAKPFSNGSCRFCVSQMPESIGNRNKVNEIIEYVHQNLKEAAKALANLDENFEYDLEVEHNV